MFSHFHDFLLFFLFMPQKNADEKIVGASTYPLGSLFSGQVGETIINLLRFLLPDLHYFVSTSQAE